MGDNTIMVNVPIGRYEELLTNEIKLKVLVKTIITSSGLSWNKDSLTFDDNAIGNMIDVYYPGVLDAHLTELQQEAIRKAKEKEK